jgi:hypothetical protein
MSAGKKQTFHALYAELVLPALVFGGMGAIAWAIRGTNGWGGIDGTILPGMLWGILWCYMCWRQGIASYGVALWLGLGIALGGELGYGQYVSWIQGNFRVGGEVIPVAPAQGWVWFVFCGIGWGAPGGVFLGWALSNRSSWQVWAARLTVPLALAGLGWLLIQWFPALFFPNYDLGIYAGEPDPHLERTVYTNTQNFTVVAWWIGALIVALIQRDKTSLVMSLLIGGGFGPGFAVAAAWCLGYAHAPNYIDWWKMWELHAGFNLGVLYALARYWWVRQINKEHRAGSDAPVAASTARLAFETVAVFFCVMLIFLEEEPGTSLFMGLLYVVFMGWLILKAARGLAPERLAALRGSLTLIYSVFLFLFVTFHGAVSTMGLMLELYSADAVDQYAWPRERILLFIPFAVLVIAGTVYAMVCVHREEPWRHATNPAVAADHITDLMTILSAVGIISIWPSEIGALYALFLCLAIWAFNRLNRHYDMA